MDKVVMIVSHNPSALTVVYITLLSYLVQNQDAAIFINSQVQVGHDSKTCSIMKYWYEATFDLNRPKLVRIV